MKHKNLIIYICVLLLSLIGSFLLNGNTVSTPFPYFSMSFKFGPSTIIGTLLISFLTINESFEDRIIGLPVSVLAFSSATILPFVVFTGAFFAILKVENIKFLSFACLNLLALLIFKNDLVISNLIFVISALLILSYSKRIIVLNIFLMYYFTLLDVNNVLYSLQSLIIPICAVLLILLYVLGKVRNALNILALSLILLSPILTMPVLLTAYSLLGLSILFDHYKEREEKVLTSNVTMATIIISISFLSGHAAVLPLIALMAVFVNYNNDKVGMNNAI